VLSGAASCILGEQAAALSYAHAMGRAAPPAGSIDVTIMSSLVCDGRDAVCEAATSDGGAAGAPTTVATLRHARDAGRAVECAVGWARE
jgi:hypothetical protein